MIQPNNTTPDRWPELDTAPPLDLSEGLQLDLSEFPPLDLSEGPQLDLSEFLPLDLNAADSWPELDTADSWPDLNAETAAGRPGTARPGKSSTAKRKARRGPENS